MRQDLEHAAERELGNLLDHARRGERESAAQQADHGVVHGQAAFGFPRRWSEMMRCWISDVPSKILVSRASRQ
jgi:hypothetical protein